jgi:Leucine-rich repeat (LRR) protein
MGDRAPPVVSNDRPLPADLAVLLGQPGLCKLNLWKSRLGVVPEAVWACTALTCLILADNDLRELPAGISRLTRLITLDLGHNQLTVLPPELGQLSELREICRTTASPFCQRHSRGSPASAT